MPDAPGPSLDMLAAMDSPAKLAEEIVRIADSRLIVESEYVAYAWRILRDRCKAAIEEIRLL